MQTRLKVLIVEDDRAMAQMCAKLIRRRGHSAAIASSSSAALDAVRNDGSIDIVISDIQMPEIGGIQLISLLRAINETLPIVLMTGYASLVNAPEAGALGATDCIMKPFDPETFLGTLEQAARSRHKVTHS